MFTEQSLCVDQGNGSKVNIPEPFYAVNTNRFNLKKQRFKKVGRTAFKKVSTTAGPNNWFTPSLGLRQYIYIFKVGVYSCPRSSTALDVFLLQSTYQQTD